MKLSILHIEDDGAYAGIFRRFIGTQAARLGMVVSVVSAPCYSATKTHATSADVVVLDLALPDSNAVETMARLARDAGGLPPVVVATGLADFSAERWKCFAAGAEDFMDKFLVTTDPAQFLERLLHAAARRKHQLATLKAA